MGNRIVEWNTWEERHKYYGTVAIRGYALIDAVYESDEDYEQAIQECYRLHQQRWAKVMKKLGVSRSVDVPSKIANELTNMLAGDLREVSGKSRADASIVHKPKRVDLAKIAEKLCIDLGIAGGIDQVLDAIRRGEV